MRLKIVQVGDPVLRRPARPLTLAEVRSEETQRLIAAMRDTMRDAPGVGLAAPQVGCDVQLAVIEDREEYWRELSPEQLAERERGAVEFQVLINPTLTPEPGEAVEFMEGCLSLAGFSALVPRARRVRVDYLDAQGTPRTLHASGWHARILQHEIDHLQGRLYIDRMHSATFTTLDNWMRHGRPR